MSAHITAQFITTAEARPLSDDMVSIELRMSAGEDGGYGGSVGIVVRTEAEARLILDAAQTALDLIAPKGHVA